MTVRFVGAGPGAPDLLTLRAARLISEAAVVLYAGSLIPAEVLSHARDDAQLIDTANLDLDAIIDALKTADAAGHDVVRLCSGDPSIFSAVGEQTRRLDALGIEWDVVPGVPAFAAAAASLRQELTLPTLGQSVVLTRVSAEATPMPAGEQLEEFARTGALLALHLAVGHAGRLQRELVGHYGEDCPVAIVEKASWPTERIVRGQLGELESLVTDAGIKRTAMVFIGRVLGGVDFCDSHLYSADRDRSLT